MKADGGFNHNLQGLRVVELLEERYPNFKGLNLSWETLEGIIRHTPNLNIVDNLKKDFSDPQPTLETQVLDLADEIAYDNHDLDDGLKSEILDEEMLKKITLWRLTEKKVKKQYSNLKKSVKIYLIIRSLIDLEVTDIIKTSQFHIKKYKIYNFMDAKQCSKRIISFSDEILQLRKELKDFLFKNLYCHWRVLRMSNKASRYIEALFNVYANNPQLLPYKFQNKKEIKRSICDYIAGMTDRYALEEYKRLFDPDTKV
ncbi:MAG: deoxyguanosinetriphosphate triphosphohydrolase, partial [Candidatus Omnitrophica bacterium]|nr:deoxyguanosinetriphosphate triphosphohydrolase [Candidatus Omnitrophota bacterium]